jgi:SNF2 family DNA or RNA helicase
MRVIAYNTPRRLGLSATPIHNMGSEIHNVLEVIIPGALGEMTSSSGSGAAAEGSCAIRRWSGRICASAGCTCGAKADVGRELPKLTITHHFCETDPAAIAT